MLGRVVFEDAILFPCFAGITNWHCREGPKHVREPVFITVGAVDIIAIVIIMSFIIKHFYYSSYMLLVSLNQITCCLYHYLLFLVVVIQKGFVVFIILCFQIEGTSAPFDNGQQLNSAEPELFIQVICYPVGFVAFRG